MIENFNQGKAGPKTHVLLIGVGGYPHLAGGTNPVPQTLEVATLLGQLTSPVASIAALYEKIIDYNNKNEWTQPLGSIEILLSPAPDSTPVLQDKNIERANLANIQNAYFSWKGRCNQDEQNVALFFFCGHGVQKKYHYLLADDFGNVAQNPWLGAFNFDDTRTAFYSCKAQTQVFFVDACRQITSDMLLTDLTVPPIENPSLDSTESINHLTLKATASSKTAYGKKNQPTYFTQAVINGFDGSVARQENNEWLVETSGLGSNISWLLDSVNPAQSSKQRCQVIIGDPIDILRRREVPDVWLEISCDPDGALPLAELTCTEDEDNSLVSFTRTAQPEPWKLNLKAGNYRLVATFQPGVFKNSAKKTSAIPPVKKEKLICT